MNIKDINQDVCLQRLESLLEEDELFTSNNFLMDLHTQSFDYARLGIVTEECGVCPFYRVHDQVSLCTHQEFLMRYDFATKNRTLDVDREVRTWVEENTNL